MPFKSQHWGGKDGQISEAYWPTVPAWSWLPFSTCTVTYAHAYVCKYTHTHTHTLLLLILRVLLVFLVHGLKLWKAPLRCHSDDLGEPTACLSLPFSSLRLCLEWGWRQLRSGSRWGSELSVKSSQTKACGLHGCRKQVKGSGKSRLLSACQGRVIWRPLLPGLQSGESGVSQLQHSSLCDLVKTLSLRYLIDELR